MAYLAADASWPLPRSGPARWWSPGTRIHPPLLRVWASRWGPGWPSSGQGCGSSASSTAAGAITICSRAGSAHSARGRARSAFVGGLARSFSTCPQRRRRQCPSGPGSGRRLHMQHHDLARPVDHAGLTRADDAPGTPDPDGPDASVLSARGFVRIDTIGPLPGRQPGNPAANYHTARHPTR